MALAVTTLYCECNSWVRSAANFVFDIPADHDPLLVSASSVIIPDEFLPNAQITILLLSIVFVVIVGDDPVPEVDEESVIVNILYVLKLQWWLKNSVI